MIDPRQGWLVAVLPADARRFRAIRHSLVWTLLVARAEFVDSEPDVELAPVAALRGDAAWAAVVVDAGDVAWWLLPEGRTRALRGALRVMRAIGMRVRVPLAKKALASHGYGEIRTIFWEPEQPLRLAGPPQHRSLRERFWLGALVIGSRASETQTLLERVAAEAAEQTGLELPLDRLRLASWGVLALGDSAVLRATVGPASKQFAEQAAALEELRTRAPTLEQLVPWPLEQGRTGLADWVVEPRLPGAPPRGVPDERLTGAAFEVLAALHAAGERREGVGSPAADAERLGWFAQALAPELQHLGDRLESRLADLPRSFAHGDFSPGNLLVREGAISGIVDWNKAGQGRLPLLDFLNLLLTIEVARSGGNHGEVFVRHLLPWARAGGDETARAFCSRIGLELHPGLLEDLAAAWWLDRHAQQVGTYSDRALRGAWLRENVERPLRALVRS